MDRNRFFSGFFIVEKNQKNQKNQRVLNVRRTWFFWKKSKGKKPFCICLCSKLGKKPKKPLHFLEKNPNLPFEIPILIFSYS